jgi:hypothetical protein
MEAGVAAPADADTTLDAAALQRLPSVVEKFVAQAETSRRPIGSMPVEVARTQLIYSVGVRARARAPGAACRG